MRDLYGKMNSNVFNQGTGVLNSQQHAFMRQLQKELKIEIASQLALKDIETVVFDIETTGFSQIRATRLFRLVLLK